MTERDLIREWMVWTEERDDRFFSQKDLAKHAGISPTYLSSIMTGTRNAGSKTIERVATAFGVSRAEFYAGPSGSVLFRAKSSPDADASHDLDTERETVVHTGWNLSWTPSENVEKLIGSGGHDVLTDSPAIFVPPIEDRATPVFEGIPVLKEAPEDGVWQPGSDLTILPRTLPGRPRAFAVRVEDESMCPLLERGSMVIADPDEPLDDRTERVTVVSRKGRLLVRRVERTETGYLFVPANPRYDPETAGVDDVAMFAVILMIPSGIISA